MTDKPAIVKSVRSELIAKCIALDKSIVKHERTSMEEFFELGRSLNKLKAGCAHGEFTKAREETGIPHQRCSLSMRAAKLRPAQFSKCSSINDLRNVLSSEPDEDDDDDKPRKPPPQPPRQTEPEAYEPPEEPAGPAGSEPTALPENDWRNDELPTVKLCRPCRISGNPVKGCPACAQINGEPTPTSTAASASTSSNQKPAQRQQTFDWDRFDTSHDSFMECLEDLSDTYPKAKHFPQYQEASDHLDAAAKALAHIRKKVTGTKVTK